MTGDEGALVEGRLRWLRRRYQNDPRARWFMPYGAALLEVGFVDDAINVLRTGLEKEPESIGARVLLGRCYLTSGALEDALEVFGHVVNSDRENAVALRGLAEIHRRLGHRSRAVDYYRALLRLMPWDLDAQEGIAQVIGPPGDPVGRLPGPSMLRIPPDLEEVRAAVMNGGSADIVDLADGAEASLVAGGRAVEADDVDRQRAAPERGRAAQTLGGHSQTVPAPLVQPAAPLVLPLRHRDAALEPDRALVQDLESDADPDAITEPVRSTRPRAARGEPKPSLRPESRPEHGIFEGLPGDLDPAERPTASRNRRRKRARGRAASAPTSSTPPKPMGQFMSWVETVSEQGRNDPIED